MTFNEFINESHKIFKRKYTSKYPSKTFYSNSGKIRNSILRYIDNSTMDIDDLKSFLNNLGASKSWLSKNKWMFNFYKNNKVKLSRYGRNMLKIIGNGDHSSSVKESYLSYIDYNIIKSIFEKAKSVAQQRLMGQAYAYKKGELDKEDIDDKYQDEIIRLSKEMSMQDLKDYAETKHDNIDEQELHLNPGMNLPGMGSVAPGEGTFVNYEDEEDIQYYENEEEDESKIGVQNEFEGGAESEIVKHLTDNIKDLEFIDADGNMEFGNYLLQFNYKDKYIELLFEVPSEYNSDDVIKNLNISVQDQNKEKVLNSNVLEKISILDTDYIEDMKKIINNENESNED